MSRGGSEAPQIAKNHRLGRRGVARAHEQRCGGIELAERNQRDRLSVARPCFIMCVGHPRVPDSAGVTLPSAGSLSGADFFVYLFIVFFLLPPLSQALSMGYIFFFLKKKNPFSRGGIHPLCIRH